MNMAFKKSMDRLSMIFGSPEKKVIKIIEKIENGQGSHKLVISLNEILNEHPNLNEETSYRLIDIIRTHNTETFGYALDVLFKIAERETDLLTNSADVIIESIQYPKLMQTAIPVLLEKFNNQNSSLRLASYYLLDMVATKHPEFFSNYTPDIVKCLQGSNIDGLIYTIKLIGEIARMCPDIINESFSMLNGLSLKHPDEMVRQEAYDAIGKFKVKEKEVKIDKPIEEFTDSKKDIFSVGEIQSEIEDFRKITCELSEINETDLKYSAIDLLASIGMDHLVVETDIYDSDSKYTKEENIIPSEKKKISPLKDEDIFLTNEIFSELGNNEEISGKFTLETGFLPDMTVEKIDAIFTPLSNQEGIISLGLITYDAKIISACGQDFVNKKIVKKLCDLLSFEENLSLRTDFRNHVYLQFSDKVVMAMSVDNNYIFLILAKLDMPFGIILEINRIVEKIEKILK